MTLTELAELVAKRTGMDREEVWAVCDELMAVLVEQIQHGEDIKIRNLGRFYWKMAASRNIRMINTGDIVSYPPRLKLKFQPSKELRKARIMQKYGVTTDEEMIKEAGKGAGPRVCPLCQAALDDGGACPNHGTEPFERTKEDGNKEKDD